MIKTFPVSFLVVFINTKIRLRVRVRVRVRVPRYNNK